MCACNANGNKRTGFAAADLLLYFNSVSLETISEETMQLVLMVAAAEIDGVGAAAFFRDHIQPIETA